MKLALLISSLLPCAPALAGQLDFEGKATAVTVYTSGSARVARTGALQLPAGRSIVRSAPLPHAAAVDSVQVSISGGGATIESVETRRILLDNKDLADKRAEHAKALKAQEDRVFEADVELRGVAQSMQSRNETLEFLSQLRKNAAQTAGREMSVQALNVETWGKALALAETGAEAARKELRGLEKRQRDAQQALEAEHRKLYELQVKGPREDYEHRVFVTVSSDKGGAGAVRLIYNVGGATWKPSYRASATLADAKAVLDIFGAVQQRSGEDWVDVDLSLSTARPDIGTDIPEIKPWYIRTAAIADKLVAGGRGMHMKLARAMEAASEEEGAMAPAAEPAAEEPPTTAVSAGVATVFSAKAKADIPSDEAEHKIPVEKVSSAIEAEHVAIPKVLPHAFLQAKTANKTPFPLMPGEIDMMVDGSFVGRGRLKLTAPGEEIRLSLGVDENVKVERNLLQDKVVRKSQGDRVATTNVFRIKAANFSKKPAKLTIMDQLPISKSEDVKITYGGSARRALRGAEFPGQLRWILELPAGGSEELEFDFTIEYPVTIMDQLQMMNSPAMQMMDMGQSSAIAY